MSSIDDLTREVVALRREMRRLKRKHAPSNEEMVQELVNDSGAERKRGEAERKNHRRRSTGTEGQAVLS